jgi:hypothetical protein
MGAGMRERQVAAGLELMTSAVRGLVDEARGVQPGKDDGLADALRAGIEQVGQAAQALHGHLLLLVAEGDRHGIAPGGIGPWLASTLDFTQGRARTLAEDARRLAGVPELEAELCSGRIGQDTVRALSRTVKATRRTELNLLEEAAETLRVARERGARAGLDRVRVLEEYADPGSVEKRHAQQRERSFARFGPVDDEQMCRFEVLLDPLRGAILRAAIESQTGAFIRSLQFDGVELVPGDVRTTEQMNAEAVTRLAEVFLDATAEQRGAEFSIPTLAVMVQDFTAPETEAETETEAEVVVPDGCAVTAYGALIPASVLPQDGDPRLRKLEVRGESGALDGRPVDECPGARLASSAQRMFLTWRDRHCRYPGCDRPITYGLNAHHRVPYADGGATTVDNMVLYCSQHHTVIHHAHQHG